MRSRVNNGLKKHLDFILIDLLCLQISYFLGFWLLRGFGNPWAYDSYRYQGIILTVAQLAAVAFGGGYHRIVRRTLLEETWAVLKFILFTLLVAMVYLFAVHRSTTVSRLLSGTAAILYTVLDIWLRQLNKRRIFRSPRKDSTLAMVLITSSAHVRSAIRQLTGEGVIRDFRLVAVELMDGADPRRFADLSIPVLPLNEEGVQYICRSHVDEVFILQPDDLLFPRHLVDDLMEMGITINYTNSLMDHFSEFHRLGQFDVLTTSFRAAPFEELMVKRLVDIVGSLLGCLITAVLAAVIGPMIYAKSPGPILYTQERIGQNGKPFKMYKFRSMYLDADKRKAELMAQNRVSDGLMFKVEDDPRIIGSEKKDKKGRPAGIGNFIRNHSLDEFPQFFNVLKGDMSLVGTRPPTKDEWEKYHNHHRIRMSFRPGITGMWQTSGRSEITDFEEVVSLDRYYIEHWSLGLDIKLIIKTVAAIFRRDGAM